MPAKSLKAERKYYLFDCRRDNLGRIATRISFVLQGKHKTDYSPNFDAGDFAVVINCKEARFSGAKVKSKLYHRFSGYPGGISTRKLGDLLVTSPEKVIREAVYGMLPKNKLRNERMKRLLLFNDSNHNLKVRFTS